MRWLLLVGLAACHAKVGGALELDGTTFDVTECRNGYAFGFSGLVLGDSSGRHVRLYRKDDGSVEAAAFAPAAPRGDMLGACGTLELHEQSSRINYVRNVEGTATLQCTGLGHTLRGTLTFENCH